MIDYVKILIKEPDIGLLTENPELNFKRVVSEKTGLLSENMSCEYKYCEITVYDTGTVKFSGSIHKLYNALTGIFAPNYDKLKKYRGYNGNQYYWHEILFVKQHLLNLFGVDSNQMILKNIEFGVNLTTYFDPQLFIKGLLLFEGNQFEYRYNDYYSQSVHDQYIVKIYNKGNQYDMPLNTLRFEIKVLKMVFQKKDIGIVTMDDINPIRMKKVHLFLKKQLEEKVFYYDNTIRKNEMTQSKRIKCKDISNPRFWQNLPSNERNRPKQLLKKLIAKNSDNLKGELLNQLNQNCIKFDRLFGNPFCIKFDHSNIGANIIQSAPRKCLVTGLDISMQKPSSLMLSNSGLKYYEKNDPKSFNWLKEILLTGNANKYEKSIYSMMSKQIRNKKNSSPDKYNPNQSRILF